MSNSSLAVKDRPPAVAGLTSSSTTLRFVVMVIVMVVTAAGTGLVWELESTPFRQGDTDCWSARNAIASEQQEAEFWEHLGDPYYVPEPYWRRDVAIDIEFVKRRPDCVHPPPPLPKRLSLFFPTVLIGLGVLLYLLLPYWRIGTRRLVDLTAVGRTDVQTEIEGAMRSAGIRARIRLDPSDPRIDGVAFGHVGRRYLGINRGLLHLFDVDRSGFDAVIGHEIGHLRNRDLDITYLSVALWWSFVVLIALPSLFLFPEFLDPSGWGSAAWWRLALMTGVIHLTRNGVLRAREYYADAYAAGDPAGRESLARLIGAQVIEPVPWWSRILRIHPVPSHRLSALTHAGWSADLGMGNAFALCLGLMLTLPTLLDTGSWILQKVLIDMHVWTFDHLQVRPAYPAVTAALAAPIGAAIAVGVWRTVLVAPRRSVPALTAGVCAAVAGGLLVGDLGNSADKGFGAGLDSFANEQLPSWQVSLVVVSLVSTVLLVATSLIWRRKASRHGNAAWSAMFAGYGAALFLCWLPGMMGVHYPEREEHPPTRLVEYAGFLIDRVPQWMPAMGLRSAAALVIAVPLLGLLAWAVPRLGGRSG